MNEKDILPFGAHKGKDIVDVDSEYLRWLLEQDWFLNKFKDLTKAIEEELNHRTKMNCHFKKGEKRRG